MGLKLNATNGGGSVELIVPDTVDSDVTLTLPSTADTILGSIPPGAVIYVLQDTAPEGYLKANGAAISRTTYANLFAAIGTHYGTGDGSTTFTLPDLRGEFLRAWDDSRGIDSSRAYGTSQADEFKSHRHGIRGGNGPVNDYVGGSAAAYGLFTDGGTLYTDYIQANTGGSETRPRNIALLACIKF